MQREQFFEAFDSVLHSHHNYLIVTHVNPDGDAIGSSLAFADFLKKNGHEAQVVVSNDFPGFLSWLPGAETILIGVRDFDAIRKAFSQADCVCLLDFNHFSRSGILGDELSKSTATKVLIDHHRDTDFGPFYCYLSETEVSSTSELITETILHYNPDLIDDNMATNLLAGIMTDTGSFAHSIYQPRTFELCSGLVAKCSSYIRIHRLIYDTFSENRLRLLGFAISNKLEVFESYATAIISLSKSELDSFNYQVGDTEGIVNYPLSLENVKMSVLITERDDVIRFSFRSKGSFSVHEVALKYFNGGGHTNAAGGSLSCSLTEAVDKLKAVLPEYVDSLKN